MLSRMTAIEAAMLSMPDQIEEIYQTIMTAPMSSDLDHRLEESIAKLRLEEEIEAELKGELHSTEPEIVVQTRNQDELRQRAVSIQKGHKNKQ